MEYVKRAKYFRIAPRTKRCRYAIDGYRSQSVKRKIGLTPFIFAAIFAALVVPFIIMNAVRTNPALAEWWVINIQNNWELVVGSLTSWLPVSIFELFVVLLILVGLFLLGRLFINLCRAKFRRILVGLLSIGVGVMYVLNLFMMSMGFGYYRATMPLMSAGEDYTKEQTIAAVRYFLDDYNALAEKLERDENGCVICPYTHTELAKRLAEEYKRLDDPYFSAYTPRVKPIANSWFLSDVLITGITFLPIGEANINVDCPPTERVSTAAHELAHTKGIQREGDANLLADYILVTSDDEYLRYCGYYSAFIDLAYAVYLCDATDEYMDILDEISQLVRIERSYAAKYWWAQPDIMGKLGEFFNNIYLKLNGAQNGTGSYDDGDDTDIIIPIDPDTGEPEIDPDTGKPVMIPVYSQQQKMFFAIYEEKTAGN